MPRGQIQATNSALAHGQRAARGAHRHRQRPRHPRQRRDDQRPRQPSAAHLGQRQVGGQQHEQEGEQQHRDLFVEAPQLLHLAEAARWP